MRIARADLLGRYFFNINAKGAGHGGGAENFLFAFFAQGHGD